MAAMLSSLLQEAGERWLQDEDVMNVTTTDNATATMAPSNSSMLFNNNSTDSPTLAPSVVATPAPSWMPSAAPTTEEERSPSDSRVLRDMFIVYGSILVVIWLLFCWVRLKYPRPYTIRAWTTKPELFTSLAADQYGFWSWMWILSNTITEDELLDQVGLDALCFLRLLRMGYKLCAVGAFNSLWLFPVYATAKSSSETDHIEDPVVMLTVSHVPPESPRFLATVFASYILFGSCMYFILREFEWFIEMRHKYLRKRVPRNYTLFCRNIPLEYRTNHGLERFFQRCFEDDCLVATNLKVTTPNLVKTVDKRTTAIGNLEHAVALHDITGVPPQHVQTESLAGALIPGGGTKVNSIEHYAAEIKELNTEITQQINAIHHKMIVASTRARKQMGSASVAEFTSASRASHPQHAATPSTYDPLLGTTTTPLLLGGGGGGGDAEQPVDADDTSLANDNDPVASQADVVVGASGSTGSTTPPANNTATSAAMLGDVSSSSKHSKKSGGGFLDNISSSAGRAVKGVTDAGAGAMKLVGIGAEDGDYTSGGFVSFKTLSTTNAAKQMVHHEMPFQFQVYECPDPDDIFWANVGREHVDLQLGNLFSRAATAVLCVFWTIPMAFISTLSSVEGLREQFDFVDDTLDKWPFLEPVLEQIAPFLIIAVNALLPYILEAFSMLEGPVSGSVVVASTFSKLAAFMIIQTFFVTAISGGLMDEIKGIIDDPLSTIDLLATSLPGQSTFFMQLAFVGTVLFIAMENLRVIPLATALLRRCIGPNLTEKERQTTYFGIRPLADPLDFEHDSNTSQMVVLYFVIILVYIPIAPLSSFILGFCFFLLRPACLHQFVYIYPTKPDSGGVIWTSFIRILIICILIAEFTIVGLLGLKKAAIATPLMFPLIIFTFLFNGYLSQEHFRVTTVLPSKECLKADQERAGEDFDFLKDQYVQEEMRNKEAFPEDLPEDRIMELGLVPDVQLHLASLQEEGGAGAGDASSDAPLAPEQEEGGDQLADEGSLGGSSKKSPGFFDKFFGSSVSA